jgi:hypothetical protein
MNSLWWLALPVLLLPVWWHRQKREQTRTLPLATARFVPRMQPSQVRVWRWADLFLLLVRCLLLLAVIAWLADPVLPWRGDAVLVAQGTDPAWSSKEIAAAGLKDAARIDMPAAEVLDWLRSHEREWKTGARLLVLGDVPMPAARPVFDRRVELRTMSVPVKSRPRHVAVISDRGQDWRKLLAAFDSCCVIDDAVSAQTELVIWDRSDAPPAGVRAPLWWVANDAAFPELHNAAQVDGMRYAESAHGRLWAVGSPPKDVDSARQLLENWQRLHYAPVPFTAPPAVLGPGRTPHGGRIEGELRTMLALLIAGLFALERILAHARRR